MRKLLVIFSIFLCSCEGHLKYPLVIESATEVKYECSEFSTARYTYTLKEMHGETIVKMYSDEIFQVGDTLKVIK